MACIKWTYKCYIVEYIYLLYCSVSVTWQGIDYDKLPEDETIVSKHVNVIPLQAWTGPKGSRKLRHMKLVML